MLNVWVQTALAVVTTPPAYLLSRMLAEPWVHPKPTCKQCNSTRAVRPDGLCQRCRARYVEECKLNALEAQKVSVEQKRSALRKRDSESAEHYIARLRMTASKASENFSDPTLLDEIIELLKNQCAALEVRDRMLADVREKEHALRYDSRKGVYTNSIVLRDKSHWIECGRVVSDGDL